ncbi:MAG: sigma 54-interacting transcriptional regulator [Polyangiaceae bacterium]
MARTEETHQTKPTGRNDSATPVGPELIAVLTCSQPRAGSSRHSLRGITRVEIGRSSERRITRQGTTLRLAFPDVRLSTHHARLELVDGSWWFEDAGSTNGSSINGRKASRCPLSDGDLLELGYSFFYFLEAATVGGRPDDQSASDLSTEPGLETLQGPHFANLARLMRIAASPVAILLRGETGTGKEVLARAIHVLSNRPGPFIAVNCGAIPDSLLESQLFGHQKGSFSGAIRDELGFVRSANQGTLFLDEVGDLPAASQAALLRLIQEGEVVPVGSARPVKVDVRILSATHQPLEVLMESDRFRRDLFARLAGFVHTLPPLRERREDLGLIIGRLVEGLSTPVDSLKPEVARALLRYDWPLNVRELQQCLATACVLAEGGAIKLDDIPPAVAEAASPSWRSAEIRRSSFPPGAALSSEDANLRRELVGRLSASGGNVSQVARDMAKARQQIQRWIRRFGITPNEYQ